MEAWVCSRSQGQPSGWRKRQMVRISRSSCGCAVGASARDAFCSSTRSERARPSATRHSGWLNLPGTNSICSPFRGFPPPLYREEHALSASGPRRSADAARFGGSGARHSPTGVLRHTIREIHRRRQNRVARRGKLRGATARTWPVSQKRALGQAPPHRNRPRATSPTVPAPKRPAGHVLLRPTRPCSAQKASWALPATGSHGPGRQNT